MQQGGEPTLEQILASIKRVMVRSDSRPAPEPIDQPSPPDGHSQPAEFADSIEPASAEEAGDVLEVAETEFDARSHDHAPAAHEGPESEPSSPPPQEVPPIGGLTRTDAASAVRQSLAALEMLGRGEPVPDPKLPEDAALDALTRAMLRPMLAQWLDANLPRIVEQQVQAEIARIIRR